MHDLDNLAVDGPGLDAELLPFGLQFFRGALQIGNLTVILAELGHGGLGDAKGDLVDIAIEGLPVNLDGGLDTIPRSDGAQFRLVLDLVILGLLPSY